MESRRNCNLELSAKSVFSVIINRLGKSAENMYHIAAKKIYSLVDLNTGKSFWKVFL